MINKKENKLLRCINLTLEAEQELRRIKAITGQSIELIVNSKVKDILENRHNLEAVKSNFAPIVTRINAADYRELKKLSKAVNISISELISKALLE